MEVRALCIRLMMNVLFLLAAQHEVCCSLKADAAFPRVVPNRQQFFEYEPIVVDCEGLMGLTGWRVLKEVNGELQPCAGTWALSISPCKIGNAIPSIDNGEYWCEIGVKKRTSSVNITVTAGSVILESPVRPVYEGGNVTFGCRNKRPSPNITARFFKDGVSMGSSRTGTMTIHGVSSFDEGLYKCSIPGAGESPQSWLTVRAEAEKEDPAPPVGPQMSLLLQICISFSIVLVVLLLLAGLLQCKKRRTVVTGDIPLHANSVMPSLPVHTDAHTDLPLDSFGHKTKKQKGSSVSRSSMGRHPSADYRGRKHFT